MKKLPLLLLLLLFKGNLLFAQNADIDLLKNINQRYTERGGTNMKIITNSIDPIGLGLPLGLFITSQVKKDKNMAFKSYTMMGSTLVNGVITLGLKYAIARDRPYVTYPNDITKHTKGGSLSFPSGHTSMAFVTATSISLAYPHWYVIAPSYLWASSVAYSRMYLGVHYPSDVLAGAIVGSASAIGTHYLFKYLKKKHVAKEPVKL